MNLETRSCQNCKLDFVIEPADFDFYKKIEVPPPTWCWRCRAMRRMSFRNMRTLHERVCDATGKKIFSLIPEDAPMPVYDRQYWISDAWDSLEYGVDYDFSRPFFAQFKELYFKVPTMSVFNTNSVNSEYGQGLDMKNSYMCFDSGECEDSAYNVTLQKAKNCFDTINTKYSELCYYSINLTQCYKTFYSRNCNSCSDVWLSQDCVGCSNCFGCSGLRNKNYYIFNQPYSKEGYVKKLEEFDLKSREGVHQARKQAEEFWIKNPVRFRHGVKDAGCKGDYIYNSSELKNCYFANEAQNCAYSQSIIFDPIKDCMDITSTGVDAELAYETSCSGLGLHRSFFTVNCETATDSQYIMDCKSVSNVFGSVGLKSKQYCVLNKQYSKEEYEELVPRIIKHMSEMPYVDSKGRTYKYGEFFPLDINPIGYNESQGQEYFPLTQKEVEEQGYRWQASKKREYQITKESKDLPETISGVDDSIVKEIIHCMHDEINNHSGMCGSNCTTAFRITPEELAFYRQMQLPLPRLCFNCRHVDRISWRNPLALYSRQCQCSGSWSSNGAFANTSPHFHGDAQCLNTFQTSYAPDRPEIIYCEQCYNSEVT